MADEENDVNSDVKDVQVQISEKLHNAVLAEAKKRGYRPPGRKAYTEAAERWLAWIERGETVRSSPLGEITAEEEKRLGSVLRYLREDPQQMFTPTLDKLAEIYPPKESE